MSKNNLINRVETLGELLTADNKTYFLLSVVDVKGNKAECHVKYDGNPEILAGIMAIELQKNPALLTVFKKAITTAEHNIKNHPLPQVKQY